MLTVMFSPDNRKIEVEEGENLLRAAMAAEVHINASCGGDGTCGKCRVIIDKGKVKRTKEAKLSPEEVKEGYVLACLVTVESNLEVRIPVESRLGKLPSEKVCLLPPGHLLSAKEWEKKLPQLKLEAPVKKFYLKMPSPNLEDSLSDLERIRRELHAKYGLKEMGIKPDVLVHLASVLRESGWEVTVTLLGKEIINVEPKDTTSKNLVLAVDLGTTTIVAQLIDVESGKVLAQRSSYNAQGSCGADVISRMVFSTKEGGLKKLQSLAAQTINKLIKDLLKMSERNACDISSVFVAGNTIMLHLFLGLDPRYIREEPYIPTAEFFPWLEAEELGLGVPSNVYLYPLPCVASYVGADIVAGILASGMYDTEKLTLYIDIGTNGEIVLGNREWLASCSCSAGPAFEGGGVKCGMQATRGAIEQVRIDTYTYEPMYITIGQTRPAGICGSGLVDLVAELFLSGIIDRRGKINLELKTPRVRKKAGIPEYVVAWENEASVNKDVVITEADVDNLIRAKAAIFAGVNILVEETGVSFSDIGQIFIAGTFGNYLEVEKVITIGLLPELPYGKFKFIGNGSLLGAHLVALSKDALEKALEVARKMAYIDLSTSAKFMDKYVSGLFLPHTDIDMFPLVKSVLKVKD